MSSKWQRLHVSNQGSIPPLLFRYSLTQDGYELYMTDLTYIWSEHLDRQHILQRADEDNTTIDPSEDAEQLGILLDKVGEALRNEAGSSTVLTHGSFGDSLQLITSTKLPSPLRPLKWTIYLAKEPQSSSTRQLLLPLIKAEAGWASRQQTLIDQLKRKDWALGKLFDKLEAMGIELSTIFPNAKGVRGSHKGSMLSLAAGHIKGVAPFDEQAWLDETNTSSDLGFASNILTETAGSGFGDTSHFENLNPPPDGWWEKLTTAVVRTAETSPEYKERSQPVITRPPNDPMDTETDNDAETEDDEFERQETPPRLRRPPVAKAKPASPKPDEETESDGADFEEEHEVVKPPQPKPPARPSRGLGRIGGKKPQPPPVSKQKSPQSPPQSNTNEPSRAPKSPYQPDSDNDRTETDSENPPSPPPKPKPSTTKPKPRGLGVIGGRKIEKQPSPPPPQQSESHPQPRKPGKLGLIGGRKTVPVPAPATTRHADPTSPSRTETASEDEADDKDSNENANAPRVSSSPGHHRLKMSSTPAPAPAPPAAQPEPAREETEQERADRKRDELKRQLEAKSKAPAKKKRKF
ncbi:XLF-domain-containing protein [Aspergillus heteromorphus CBS 117.55]|uniref:Non-homologous end-joining factor 1 n=1 Tax=Aspergillus heteromorphus CBS 117.55 TaxID=1448321 RepID=A0A317X3H3_9EURO|nr:XLF-domain-containing protein [Aspergillus heteromorphus CBS 117.55]PWY91100.1 XLF-domain-containing protein [Aspergillus heteromorphus CBS 117.55]